MKLNFGGRAVGILAGLALVGSLASADPVVGAGTFNLAGAIDVANTAFTFGSMSTPPPGDEMARTTLPLTGAFSGMTSGTNVQLRNLTAAGGVTPGTPFNFTNWIDLSNAGAAIRLDLNNISVNPTLHACSAADDAPGSICAARPGSPITLEQGTDGVTALMNLSGVAYFISSPGTTTPWTGKLAADFTMPGENTISGLLNVFTTTGHITTGYQANITTTPTSTVPEPGALAAVGLGLLGAGLLKKRKANR